MKSEDLPLLYLIKFQSDVMKVCSVDTTGGVSYRGEGNANLVLALPGTGFVLRLPNSK